MPMEDWEIANVKMKDHNLIDMDSMRAGDKKIKLQAKVNSKGDLKVVVVKAEKYTDGITVGVDVAKKLGWEYSKLSTPMEFIEYIIPVLEIERGLRKKLLSLSALKSCFCMYRPDFLDVPYSIIGLACIIHTADTKPFKKFANHIKETCYQILIHSDSTRSPNNQVAIKQIESLKRAYTLLESSTNEIVNNNNSQ
ncbi:hypothetical protein LOD99_15629 [Oopsacas minuta]|uniref:Uncharacterized protein n=1 Tax=Oopsacas minuta TaxID=111878 RepID=A0AAV7KC70_9METZ|nr:hypothetical protein LOD99_15629 [Oopsacas minuta]